MYMSEVRIVRKRDARNFMDEDEHCRHYMTTEKITFGTSTLLPGKHGGVDPGHKTGDEIFFVAKGGVIIHFPKKGRYDLLEEGDIVVIPPGEPHQLFNTSEQETVVSWSLAPPD